MAKAKGAKVRTKAAGALWEGGKPHGPRGRVEPLVVRVRQDGGLYVVDERDRSLVPRRVYWRHDARGRAVGPDGAALGFWASREIRVSRLLEGGRLGARRRVFVSDIAGRPDPRVLGEGSPFRTGTAA